MTYRWPAALAGVLLVIPSAASACTVCFGGADANLVDGFFWGVLILMALPFTMTAAFIYSLARAARRKKVA